MQAVLINAKEMRMVYDDYKRSAEYLVRQLGGFEPQYLLILGSGLGGVANAIENPLRARYDAIPNMKLSTAPGHAGEFVAGTLAGKRVLAMRGRLHFYEGHSAEEVAFPVRLARLAGADSLVITNACGGVNTSYKPGQLIILSDIIKLAAPNPLTGPNIPEFGPRFNDMSYLFDAKYRELFKSIGAKRDIELREGVYFYTTGPQYETPAEIRAIRILGGDVVGMSTAPEVIAARHCGMRILGVSLVTNMAAGVLDKPLGEKEVLDEAEKARDVFTRLMLDFLESAS
ncbi:MAG: purine-nucleoside phosphorylase [Clostridiales bacterium]|jgi:purine-nucleoside phosphorylase|nr:purine-nucleoside phosphorylase [Clostridiales bacterium]